MEDDTAGKEKKVPFVRDGKYLKAYWASRTPEELAARKARISATLLASSQKRKQQRIELEAKAQEMIPRLIAEELLMADDKQYIPSQKTIDKLKELLSSPGKSIEGIRSHYFPTMSDTAWSKLMKYAFKSQVSQIEDVGLELVRARQSAIGALRARVKQVQDSIDLWRERQKELPKRKQLTAPVENVPLLNILIGLEKRLFEMEIEFANTLHSIGAVGDQVKSASFHIHMGTPRPPAPEPKTINITPNDNDGHRD